MNGVFEILSCFVKTQRLSTATQGMPGGEQSSSRAGLEDWLGGLDVWSRQIIFGCRTSAS